MLEKYIIIFKIYFNKILISQKKTANEYSGVDTKVLFCKLGSWCSVLGEVSHFGSVPEF